SGDSVGGGAGPWVGVGPGSIASLALTDGGINYQSRPNLTISGPAGSSGATGTVIDMQVNHIASFNCTTNAGNNPCSRYANGANAIQVVFNTGNSGGSGAVATGTKTTVANGSGTINFAVTNGGSGYTSRPSVTVVRTGADFNYGSSPVT